MKQKQINITKYIILIIVTVNLTFSALILNKITNIKPKTPVLICNQEENPKIIKEIYKETITNNYTKNNYIYETIEKTLEPKEKTLTEEPIEEIDINKQLIDLLNNYRKQNNLPEFILNDSLIESSKIRSKELVENMSHNRPDNSWYESVITISHTAAGEILYSNNGDIDNAFNNIINNKINDEILLNDVFTNVGINIYIDLTTNIYYYNLLFTS